MRKGGKMKKVAAFLSVFTLSFSLFAATTSYIDGEVIVAAAGELPQGLFIKAVGYLPGDSVNVTNPVTGTSMELLNIGQLDEGQGFAVIISQEAAQKLGISSDSILQIKLSKRSGSYDKSVIGTATLSRIASSTSALVEYDSVSENDEIPQTPKSEATAQAVLVSEKTETFSPASAVDEEVYTDTEDFSPISEQISSVPDEISVPQGTENQIEENSEEKIENTDFPPFASQDELYTDDEIPLVREEATPIAQTKAEEESPQTQNEDFPLPISALQDELYTDDEIPIVTEEAEPIAQARAEEEKSQAQKVDSKIPEEGENPAEVLPNESFVEPEFFDSEKKDEELAKTEQFYADDELPLETEVENPKTQTKAEEKIVETDLKSQNEEAIADFLPLDDIPILEENAESPKEEPSIAQEKKPNLEEEYLDNFTNPAFANDETIPLEVVVKDAKEEDDSPFEDEKIAWLPPEELKKENALENDLPLPNVFDDDSWKEENQATEEKFERIDNSILLPEAIIMPVSNDDFVENDLEGEEVIPQEPEEENSLEIIIPVDISDAISNEVEDDLEGEFVYDRDPDMPETEELTADLSELDLPFISPYIVPEDEVGETVDWTEPSSEDTSTGIFAPHSPDSDEEGEYVIPHEPTESDAEREIVIPEEPLENDEDGEIVIPEEPAESDAEENFVIPEDKTEEKTPDEDEEGEFVFPEENVEAEERGFDEDIDGIRDEEGVIFVFDEEFESDSFEIPVEPSEESEKEEVPPPYTEIILVPTTEKVPPSSGKTKTSTEVIPVLPSPEKSAKAKEEEIFSEIPVEDVSSYEIPVEIPTEEIPFDQKIPVEEEIPVEPVEEEIDIFEGKEIPEAYVCKESALKANSYYVQIIITNKAGCDEIAEKYGRKYPIIFVPTSSGAYKVLVGPLTRDEYGVVLERFKEFGYKGAFLKRSK